MKVLCLPEAPVKSDSKLHKIISHLGWTFSHDYDLCIWCRDTETPECLNQRPMLNFRKVAITKSRVNDVQQFVFDYSAKVEPGCKIVEKCETGRYHGSIVGSVMNRKGFSYSKFITNHPTKPWVEEHRIAIIGSEMVATRTKRMKGSDGFPSVNRIPGSSNYNVPWRDVLSLDEMDRMLSFATHIGIDYGEIDTMRDLDGKLYILDVNSMPSGPSHYSFRQDQFFKIIPHEANLFREQFGN